MRMPLRLASAIGPDARCQLTTREDDACGAVLEGTLRHASLCGKGPAHLRPHTALITVLRRDLERSGAGVDIERVVPEWYNVMDDGTISEARLDLVVRYPGSAATERIDVSVRSPFAACFARAQGGRATAVNVGVAAREGELDMFGKNIADMWRPWLLS